MKKILSALLCAALMLAAASCSSSKDTRKNRHERESRTELKKDADDPATAAESSSLSLDPGTDFQPDFTFSTTDRDGNIWNETTFSQYELTMINFWEPWCGPCVSEIGDLERLYEDYRDKGFQIIGVYSEQTMESEVDGILRDNNVSYPILHYTSEFDRFQSGYVPTTVFVDRQGKVLTMSDGTGSIIGSNSYSDWAAIIENLI